MNHSSQHSSIDLLRTRVSLLGQARDGQNNLAWEELHRYYEPFVAKILQGMGFGEVNLNDAKQQVFIRLWNGLSSYQRQPERAKFRSWFARLIRNTALNIIRSEKNKPQETEISDPSLSHYVQLSDKAEIEAKVEQEWQRYVVELALERAKMVFSGNAIAVFQLSLQGKGVEEIAEQLHIKPNTVYTLKHRVKTVILKEIKQLKQDLETFDTPTAL